MWSDDNHHIRLLNGSPDIGVPHTPHALEKSQVRTEVPADFWDQRVVIGHLCLFFLCAQEWRKECRRHADQSLIETDVVACRGTSRTDTVNQKNEREGARAGERGGKRAEG